MKKKLKGLNLIRENSSPNELLKDNHYEYFQSLQQKLIDQSDKIATIMNTTSPTGIKNIKIQLKNQQKNTKCTQEIMKYEETPLKYLNEKVSATQIMLKKYLQDKRKILSNCKSDYFQVPKDTQTLFKRKFTYNFSRNDQKPHLQHPLQIQSQGINQQLKGTASTNNSSSKLMRTIQKIKIMSEQSRNSSEGSSSRSRRKKEINISDFQILKFLQQGQFGSVYLARHIVSNFICAIKKVAKQLFASDIRFINQLIREIKIQSHLDHPNIVQLYSFFDDEQHIYLILQYCSGSNLYNILRREKRFSEQKVKQIIKQTCHALEFMHDNDIIHRDIKPQNILLHEGIVKVCDFGWSIHSPLLRDTRCGTPLYSSPEVVQKQQYDNKVDIWNIGILTYELLYGRVPFEIRAEEDLMKVVDEDIYFPKSQPVSGQAKHFILKCLRKNPKERESMMKLVDDEFLQD